jgi:hypothetical protein
MRKLMLFFVRSTVIFNYTSNKIKQKKSVPSSITQHKLLNPFPDKVV